MFSLPDPRENRKQQNGKQDEIVSSKQNVNFSILVFYRAGKTPNEGTKITRMISYK